MSNGYFQKHRLETMEHNHGHRLNSSRSQRTVSFCEPFFVIEMIRAIRRTSQIDMNVFHIPYKSHQISTKLPFERKKRRRSTIVTSRSRDGRRRWSAYFARGTRSRITACTTGRSQNWLPIWTISLSSHRWGEGRREERTRCRQLFYHEN